MYSKVKAQDKERYGRSYMARNKADAGHTDAATGRGELSCVHRYEDGKYDKIVKG